MTMFYWAGIAENPASKTHQWHVGEKPPASTSRVMTFQADGDELAVILNALKPQKSNHPIEIWNYQKVIAVVEGITGTSAVVGFRGIAYKDEPNAVYRHWTAWVTDRGWFIHFDTREFQGATFNLGLEVFAAFDRL